MLEIVNVIIQRFVVCTCGIRVREVVDLCRLAICLAMHVISNLSMIVE